MNKGGKNFVNLMKRYGPGFVAISKTSGRVVAHGHDIQKMWKDAEKKRLDFSKFTVTHVPRYGSISLYLRG